MDYNTDRQGVASSVSAARPAHESIVLNPNERRIARDGEAYALEEFAEFYGFTRGLAIWQQSECQDSAEQPVGITASHSQDENSAAQPVGITTSHSQDEDSAEQPGGITVLQWLASSPEQCVGTTAGHSEDSTEQSVGTTAGHPQGQQVRLAWDELVAMTPRRGCGGKAANVEQKRLRAHCFANGLWEVDLTDSTYDWRQLLKAMPEANSRTLVGTGVVKFSFRLLQNVRDSNYIKIDSGERHVFEIASTDGERWQLHFHKNGSMDKPVRIPPTAVLHSQPMNNAAGEEGPTWYLQDILDNSPQDNLPVGRHEVSMALNTILQSHSPQEVPFAVDITAISAFPWHRWLRNVVPNREIIGSGIVKVFALCLTSIQEAQIVFCHPDDTYTLAKPGKRLEYEQLTGWRDCQTFAQAPVQTASWLQTRALRL